MLKIFTYEGKRTAIDIRTVRLIAQSENESSYIIVCDKNLYFEADSNCVKNFHDLEKHGFMVLNNISGEPLAANTAHVVGITEENVGCKLHFDIDYWVSVLDSFSSVVDTRSCKEKEFDDKYKTNYINLN